MAVSSILNRLPRLAGNHSWTPLLIGGLGFWGLYRETDWRELSAGCSWAWGRWSGWWSLPAT